jgi:hypothetical protein
LKYLRLAKFVPVLGETTATRCHEGVEMDAPGLQRLGRLSTLFSLNGSDHPRLLARRFDSSRGEDDSALFAGILNLYNVRGWVRSQVTGEESDTAARGKLRQINKLHESEFSSDVTLTGQGLYVVE